MAGWCRSAGQAIDRCLACSKGSILMKIGVKLGSRCLLVHSPLGAGEGQAIAGAHNDDSSRRQLHTVACKADAASAGISIGGTEGQAPGSRGDCSMAGARPTHTSTPTTRVGQLGHLHAQHAHDLVAVGGQANHQANAANDQDPAEREKGENEGA